MGRLGDYKKSIVFVLVIAAGLLLSLFFTVNNQYISKNTTTAVLFPHYPVNRSIDMITVVREPLISVPFSSVLPLPGDIVDSTLEVTIYLNNKSNSDVNVFRVTLSSPVGSVLTYAPNFSLNKTFAPRNSTIVDYFLKIGTRHNLEIGNTSGTYRVNIFYTDPKNPPIYLINATNNKTVPGQTETAAAKTTKSTLDKTNQSSTVISSHTVQVVNNPNREMQYDFISFTWPIKSMDLTTLSYFWIVLIGVILSKLSTRISSQPSSQPSSQVKKPGPISNLSNNDFLWIGISAIIALLIFSNFQQQVHLTGNILYNISLAFAFGFGFDRILDTTSKLTK